MICEYASTDVLQGGGIEVLGPVYADESAEKAPLLHHVASLVRRGVGRSHGSDDRPYSVPMSASAEAEWQAINIPCISVYYKASLPSVVGLCSRTKCTIYN